MDTLQSQNSSNPFGFSDEEDNAEYLNAVTWPSRVVLGDTGLSMRVISTMNTENYK